MEGLTTEGDADLGIPGSEKRSYVLIYFCAQIKYKIRLKYPIDRVQFETILAKAQVTHPT